MMFQVTEIEFDFDSDSEMFDDGLSISTEDQNAIIEETIGQIWEVDDADDLVDEITCATGWCIKSLDYRHILK
jgi:mannosyltransferase OCH1-like enzyme